jgi:hypothetical protein
MENLINFALREGLEIVTKNPETILYLVLGILVYSLISSIFTKKTYNAYNSKNIRKWG